ncbi:MAG: DUF4332 domain-containing protein [Gemmatimonadetes bacterium]|nr:DUF4332 domain-containing protein [Gemmatimonadota bacterium]
MWLLAQILIYLLVAFLIGGVGGWMLRGRQAHDAQLHLQERFKQMVSSIEMERDAARLKVRDLSARLAALEGARQEGSRGDGIPFSAREGPEAQEPPSPMGERPLDTTSVWSAPADEDRPRSAEGPADAAALEGPTDGQDQGLDPGPGEEAPGPWERSAEPAAEDGADPIARDSVEHVHEVELEPSAVPTPEDAPGPGATPAGGEVLQPVVGAAVEDPPGPGAETTGEDPSGPHVAAADEDSGEHGKPAPSPPTGGTRWELVEEPATPESNEPASATQSTADDAGKVDARPLSHLGEVPPQASRKLRAMGIEDTSALHGHFAEGVDPADLAASLGVEARRVRRWKALAELLELPTVDAAHAWLLEIAGVASLRELAAEDPAELTQRMVHLNRDQALGLPVPEAARVAAWVEGAGQRQERG